MLTKRRARVLRARRGVLREALQLALLPGMLERELEPGPLRAPCEVACNNAKPTLRPRNKLPRKLAPNSRKKRKSSKPHVQGLDTLLESLPGLHGRAVLFGKVIEFGQAEK